MVINNLIKELVQNVNTNNIPKKIDLVLDGGAFNGAFQLGALLYLKELERNKIIEIDKVSGVSIGALLGVAYILDKLDIAVQYFNETLHFFKNEGSLKNTSNILNKFVVNEMKEDDYSKLNDKMYITYYNNKNKTQIIKSTYKNNEDVEFTMNKSSFIPYLMGSTTYKDKFVDGAFPHIFKFSKSKKILFLYLSSYSKIKFLIKTKDEETLHGRIIDGIFDVNKFFNKNKRTDMCSYIEDWNIIDFTQFRLREIIFVVLLFLMDTLRYIKNKIPEFIIESNQYSRILTIFQQYYIDIVYHFLT
jgi:hypothetical protein